MRGTRAAVGAATAWIERAGRAVRRRVRTVLRGVLLLSLRAAYTVVRRPPAGGERPPVVFLLQNAYGMGGTIRTVLNLAGRLAQDHDVEIVSVLRTRAEAFFPVPAGVAVRVLEDRHAGNGGRAARFLSRFPSVLVPAEDASSSSVTLWTDTLLLRALWRLRSRVVIGTRPSLNLLVARGTAPEVVRIGQDHMNLRSYRPYLRTLISGGYRRLDALTVLTEVSLSEYRAVLAGARTTIVRIPNALPEIHGGPADADAKVIVTAGRLNRQKGYDLLIEAYGEIAAKHPDWVVRIFGAGKQRGRLQRMIDERGLGDQVRLMGRTTRMGEELAKASVYALSSRFEGLPMVLIEAMSKGMAVVAFDCPTGPAEMIHDGRDGLLVDPGDTEAFARALLALIEDPATRHRLGRAAAESSKVYSLDVVGAHWERLLAELVSARSR